MELYLAHKKLSLKQIKIHQCEDHQSTYYGATWQRHATQENVCFALHSCLVFLVIGFSNFFRKNYSDYDF